MSSNVHFPTGWPKCSTRFVSSSPGSPGWSSGYGLLSKSRWLLVTSIVRLSWHETSRTSRIEQYWHCCKQLQSWHRFPSDAKRPETRNDHMHSEISDSLVTICTDERYHPKSMGDKFVGKDGRVGFNFNHLNRCSGCLVRYQSTIIGITYRWWVCLPLRLSVVSLQT